MLSAKIIARFRRVVWDYYHKYGRDLPWRETRDPYKILVSEIMLQQTQVPRVLKKYPGFLQAFPNVEILRQAPLARVLKVWQGMGYNRRALMLKRLAEIVVREYGAKLPRTSGGLEKLPGVGKATAGAIAAFAFNYPSVFIETNIRRVFIYFFFSRSRRQFLHSQVLKNLRMKKHDVQDKEILPLVEKTLDRKNPREWYWALMDYGAMLAQKIENPNRRSRHYKKQSPFHGSYRELRGKVLSRLLQEKAMSQKYTKVLKELAREGFIARKGNRWRIKEHV